MAIIDIDAIIIDYYADRRADIAILFCRHIIDYAIIDIDIIDYAIIRH
jgi:hypothetical protein